MKEFRLKLVELLEANAGRKVSSVSDDILALLDAVKITNHSGKTFVKDEEGNVVAIFCYYHKRWEKPSEVPYGIKASTATGLNTMCKQGVSNWTKQQRQAQLAKNELLTKVGTGELAIDEISCYQLTIEAGRTKIIDLVDLPSYDEAPTS